MISDVSHGLWYTLYNTLISKTITKRYTTTQKKRKKERRAATWPWKRRCNRTHTLTESLPLPQFHMCICGYFYILHTVVDQQRVFLCAFRSIAKFKLRFLEIKVNRWVRHIFWRTTVNTHYTRFIPWHPFVLFTGTFEAPYKSYFWSKRRVLLCPVPRPCAVIHSFWAVNFENKKRYSFL